MIYTDGYCVISDYSIPELHEYAEEIGLSKESFLLTGACGVHPRYKIYGNVRKRVLEDKEIIQVTTRRLIALLNVHYNFPTNDEQLAEHDRIYGNLPKARISKKQEERFKMFLKDKGLDLDAHS